MPHSSSSPRPAPAPSAPGTTPRPFLLTHQQGVAARRLLGYVAALPLHTADAQLLATVVAIRAARTGIGNLTAQDLRALRLSDAEGAVAAVAVLGWRGQEALFGDSPDVPVPVTVPDLGAGPENRLPFGKLMRSRVSGWTTRTLAAKPLRKTSSEARLTALFLAAHGPSDAYAPIPGELPGWCRAALPELLAKGFLLDADADRYRLADPVRHLSGMRPPPPVPSRADGGTATPAPTWGEWKARASAALRRHVEAVENCPQCALPTEKVAEAFMRAAVPVQADDKVRAACAAWEAAHPDEGPRAARFAAAFRASHGHGPSVKQLCLGMGWGKQRRELRVLVVRRLIAGGWLTNTDPVPWTLRPGRAVRDGTGVSATAGAR
ncbi:hypothetical protein [Streptomyces griseus]|uniref:hypothetical protein n=1 Tax=Streptomyces griseus TaxID=1911 RepID=UPI0008407A6E|nr:hypothetical protein [Streptomyces griseus]